MLHKILLQIFVLHEILIVLHKSYTEFVIRASTINLAWVTTDHAISLDSQNRWVVQCITSITKPYKNLNNFWSCDWILIG